MAKNIFVNDQNKFIFLKNQKRACCLSVITSPQTKRYVCMFRKVPFLIFHILYNVTKPFYSLCLITVSAGPHLPTLTILIRRRFFPLFWEIMGWGCAALRSWGWTVEWPSMGGLFVFKIVYHLKKAENKSFSEGLVNAIYFDWVMGFLLYAIFRKGNRKEPSNNNPFNILGMASAL